MRTLIAIALGLVLFSLGAPPTRAQVKLGCGAVDPTNYDCSQWFPNCQEYVSDVTYSANEDGEVQSNIEDSCCGRPFLVWEQIMWSDCVIAGPQRQAARGAWTGSARLSAKWSVPGPQGGDSKDGPASPQPMYLRICTGDYELYVASSP